MSSSMSAVISSRPAGAARVARAGSSKATLVGTPVSASPAHAGRRSASLVVKATAQNVNRREAMAAVATFAGVALNAQPAFAGFFDGKTADEVYTEETSAIIAEAEAVLAFERGDPARAEAVAALRPHINTWVARYRRDGSITGKPSYGNTYSALDAIAGHFNNFGLDYPIPKKRADRVKKELEDATKLLGRGR